MRYLPTHLRTTVNRPINQAWTGVGRRDLPVLGGGVEGHVILLPRHNGLRVPPWRLTLEQGCFSLGHARRLRLNSEVIPQHWKRRSLFRRREKRGRNYEGEKTKTRRNWRERKKKKVWCKKRGRNRGKNEQTNKHTKRRSNWIARNKEGKDGGELGLETEEDRQKLRKKETHPQEDIEGKERFATWREQEVKKVKIEENLVTRHRKRGRNYEGKKNKLKGRKRFEWGEEKKWIR